jgi:hypothetical protein
MPYHCLAVCRDLSHLYEISFICSNASFTLLSCSYIEKITLLTLKFSYIYRNTKKDKNGLSSGSESDDCDDDLFVNTNRPPVLQYSDDSDSEEEENIAKDEEDEQDK